MASEKVIIEIIYLTKCEVDIRSRSSHKSCTHADINAAHLQVIDLGVA